ncbi:MAG: polyprenol monophosphomannose synthase [Candidatus Xenobia bacterium]
MEHADFSLVIPTYNERDTLPPLCEKLFAVFASAGVRGEVVFVDDSSPDGTGDVAEGLKAKYAIQVLHRPGKLGLSSAVIDGFMVATAPIMAVMDADGSHDASILPRMVEIVRDGEAELVVGSRYVPGGGTQDWPWFRQFASWVAVCIGRLLSPIHDITSGFFVFRRDVIDGVTLNPIGFKILLEIAVMGHFARYAEVPYVFRDRLAGQSKFNRKEVMNYFKQVASLWKYRGESRRKQRVRPAVRPRP